MPVCVCVCGSMCACIVWKKVFNHGIIILTRPFSIVFYQLCFPKYTKITSIHKKESKLDNASPLPDVCYVLN